MNSLRELGQAKVFASRADSNYRVLGILVTPDNRDFVSQWMRSIGCKLGRHSILTDGQYLLCSQRSGAAWNMDTHSLNKYWVETTNAYQP
jgi:hypothetical protein